MENSKFGSERESGRKVFLSHSSEDKNKVEALRAALDKRGIGCYLDALELRAGDELTAALKEQVQEARAFLVVLSPAAVSSDWVKREIEWALAAEDLASETGGSYRFLPVFTGGILPGFLDWLGRPDLLGIDANGRPLQDVAGEIAQALGVRRASAPGPGTALPDRGADPRVLRPHLRGDGRQRARARKGAGGVPAARRPARGAGDPRLREPARRHRARRAELVRRDVTELGIRWGADRSRDRGPAHRRTPPGCLRISDSQTGRWKPRRAT